MLNHTDETLTFSRIAGTIPNRGSLAERYRHDRRDLYGSDLRYRWQRPSHRAGYLGGRTATTEPQISRIGGPDGINSAWQLHPGAGHRFSSDIWRSDYSVGESDPDEHQRRPDSQDFPERQVAQQFGVPPDPLPPEFTQRC